MDELFGNERICRGIQDILPECDGEVEVTVRFTNKPSVTYSLKDALVSEKRPGDIDPEGNLIQGGCHTLSIFGLVKKVGIEP